MSERKEFTVTDFAEILNQKRVPLSAMQRAKRIGEFPYYGASGIIDYVDDYLFEGEHVLVSEDGENLKSRQTPIAFIADGKFWVNNHAHILKGYQDFHNQLIVYYLQNLDLNPYITGAVQPKLSKGSLLSIPFYLPEDETIQRAIASVLSSLDDKIDLLHRQNQTLEQMAETLFRQWFVEEADEEWEMVRLANFVSTNTSSINKDYPFKEIEYLDTGSLTQGKWGDLQRFSLSEAPSRAKRLVQHNDILFSTVRPNQLHYGIVRNPIENLVVSTGFCVFTCHSISPYFVYYLLTDKGMTEYLHSIAEGSTSAYPSLKPNDLESIEFPLPAAKAIETFHELVDAAWSKIESNYNQIRTLSALRDTLLPKLMSGEVRVKN